MTDTDDTGASVLLVDDDPDGAAMVETFLERADPTLSVQTVTDPTAGLDRVAADGIDCVVSDYHMPGMDGLSFLKRVDERAPGTGRILYTCDDDPELVADTEAAEITFVHRIADPDHYGTLADAILDAAGSRSRTASDD